MRSVPVTRKIKGNCTNIHCERNVSDVDTRIRIIERERRVLRRIGLHGFPLESHNRVVLMAGTVLEATPLLPLIQRSVRAQCGQRTASKGFSLQNRGQTCERTVAEAAESPHKHPGRQIRRVHEFRRRNDHPIFRRVNIGIQINVSQTLLRALKCGRWEREKKTTLLYCK